MSIKLSIIIPVYNVERYVGETLESVFETSAAVDEFEVIIVNDGTKDGSMDVVQQFSGCPNLKIVEHNNQGLSAARMNGVSVAQGEFVWFIDSDDWLVDDGVGRVLALIKDRPDVDVLMFPLQRIIEEDPSNNHLDYQFSGEASITGIEVMRDLKLYMWCAQRYVFKRSLMDSPWLFFPLGRLHEDEYFAPVLMCLANQVCVFDYPVYMHRIRNGSIMTTIDVRSSYDIVAVHKLLIRFMEQKLPSSEWPWFRAHCLTQLETSYSFNASNFETSRFRRFASREGLYVWKEWKTVYRDKSLRKKLGQLFYFLNPALRKKYSALMSRSRK